jgi:hypothetical protein
MRLSICLLLAAVMIALLPAAASGFRFTHKLSMTAEFTDNWSVSSPQTCSRQGTGSVTMTLRTKGYTRFRPEGTRRGGRNGRGMLSLAVPNGSQVLAMSPRKSEGTITTVDNTYPLLDPTNPDWTCLPIEKQGCGTKAARKSLIFVRGWDYSHLYARASTDSFGDCGRGFIGDWYEPGFGGGFDGEGNLKLGPVTERKLKRRARTVLTATDQKTFTGTGGDETITDNVTRKITVTITKLRR